MKKLAIGTAKSAVKAVLWLTAGGLITLLVVAVVVLEKRPELEVWHLADLDEEFTRRSPERTLDDYRALEDRLFAELEEKVGSVVAGTDLGPINRFQRGSMSDPGGWPTNWNRTYEWPVDAPKAGVLLLHGMSDSPYSLRELGAEFHRSGAWIVGLRLPGHGTAPSGLVRTRWEDMAAAVRLAARHLRERIGPGRPLVIVGYSNGGALAVEHALRSIDGADDEPEEHPRIDRIVLVSPAIGVTPAAALAIWQGRLGRLLGFEKLAWNSIALEYDPFKYGSFAVNAGTQSHRITVEIRERLDRLATEGRLGDFPPVLAFQSAVDATVSTEALIANLFARLPENGHELVLFDINRLAAVEHLLVRDPKVVLAGWLNRTDFDFTLSVVTNVDDTSADVVLRRRRPGGAAVETVDLGMAWPRDMYSLSHIALPFSREDPLYGPPRTTEGEPDRITLGGLVLRGERGALGISPGDMLRQRWNPFWSFLARRSGEAVFGPDRNEVDTP